QGGGRDGSDHAQPAGLAEGFGVLPQDARDRGGVGSGGSSRPAGNVGSCNGADQGGNRDAGRGGAGHVSPGAGDLRGIVQGGSQGFAHAEERRDGYGLLRASPEGGGRHGGGVA